MKCLLSVCLVAVACAGAVVQTVMQSSTETPAMTKGVNVEMASAKNAQPMPAADNADAWVVTVDESGRLYFGAAPMTSAGLKEWMISHPRKRDAKLYIKADARATYASVEKALNAASAVEFTAPVLLVNQPGATASTNLVPPKGLEVLAGTAPPAGTVATVVQLLKSGQQQPLLRVNGDEIPWSTLGDTLMRHFQKGDAKVILLKLDSQLSFAQVVQVIDLCRGTGAAVAIVEPTV